MFFLAPARSAPKNTSRLLWVTFIILCLGNPSYSFSDSNSRSLLVITDMEPDDHIALMLLAAEFPQEIVAVGTTVMHAGRKQVLARQFVQQLGLPEVPVIQGSGGDSQSYLEIASSRAAREYEFEGQGVLPQAELVLINNEKPRSSEDLSRAIRSLLKEHDDIEIVLLAPATDLVHALKVDPSIKTRIKHIHVSGGWSEKTLPSGEVARRTSYNWNMDPKAAAALMSMKTIPMTLYSTHVIRRDFSGGTVNKESFPEIINELKSQRYRVSAFETFLHAVHSWDKHVMQTIPRLKAVIGDNAGYQFTPADPILPVGMTRPEMITSSRMVDISIDLEDLDPATGFNVMVKIDPASHIAMVGSVDIEVFRDQLLHGLQLMPTALLNPLASTACGSD